MPSQEYTPNTASQNFPQDVMYVAPPPLWICRHRFFWHMQLCNADLFMAQQLCRHALWVGDVICIMPKHQLCMMHTSVELCIAL